MCITFIWEPQSCCHTTTRKTLRAILVYSCVSQISLPPLCWLCCSWQLLSSIANCNDIPGGVQLCTHQTDRGALGGVWSTWQLKYLSTFKHQLFERETKKEKDVFETLYGVERRFLHTCCIINASVCCEQFDPSADGLQIAILEFEF